MTRPTSIRWIDFQLIRTDDLPDGRCLCIVKTPHGRYRYVVGLALNPDGGEYGEPLIIANYKYHRNEGLADLDFSREWCRYTGLEQFRLNGKTYWRRPVAA